MDIKELRNEIESAISISSLSGSRSNRMQCPFHNSAGLDMAISHEDNKWRCYGACDDGRWHNVFEWVMQEQGCDFKTALHTLADQAGISLSQSKERTDILSTVQRWYHERIWEHPEALAYLRRRGFSDEHIFKRQLGYAHDMLPDTVPVRSLVHVDLLRVGVNGHYPTFRERIVYPVYDNRFNQVQMQGRLIRSSEPVEGKTPPPKYMALSTNVELKGRSIYHCLGGEEILKGKVDEVFLCEGWPDRETLAAWFIPSVCLFGHSGIDRHAARLKIVKRVYVVLDPDEASQRNLMVQLYQLALKIPHVEFYVIHLYTDGMDLNDWAMSGKPAGQYLNPSCDEAKVAALYAMRDAAKPFIQELIDTWGQKNNMIQPLAQLIARSEDPERWVHALATALGETPTSIKFLIRVLAPEDIYARLK